MPKSILLPVKFKAFTHSTSRADFLAYECSGCGHKFVYYLALLSETAASSGMLADPSPKFCPHCGNYNEEVEQKT